MRRATEHTEKIVIVVNKETAPLTSAWVSTLLDSRPVGDQPFPCVISGLRWKLTLCPFMDADTPSDLYGGQQVAIMIYIERNPTAAAIGPSTIDGSIVFEPTQDLLAYDFLAVDKGPRRTQQNDFPDYAIDGTILVGPVAAPAGTGTAGPWAVTLAAATDEILEIEEFGGTTVSTCEGKYSTRRKFNMGDRLIFWATPLLNTSLPTAHSGHRLFGSIEFFINK